MNNLNIYKQSMEIEKKFNLLTKIEKTTKLVIDSPLPGFNYTTNLVNEEEEEKTFRIVKEKKQFKSQMQLNNLLNNSPPETEQKKILNEVQNSPEIIAKAKRFDKRFFTTQLRTGLLIDKLNQNKSYSPKKRSTKKIRIEANELIFLNNMNQEIVYKDLKSRITSEINIKKKKFTLGCLFFKCFR